MGEFAFQTLRESITSAIRSKILTGELQPGVKLAEQKLAEEFGSSRAPIREALRQLEQEGMVEYSRNVGCSVRRVKPEDAYEIYLLRANLEMTALRALYDTLTAREKQIMAEVALGKLNKTIAYDLGVTESTVKVHRHNVMHKMRLKSIPALTMAMQCLKRANAVSP